MTNVEIIIAEALTNGVYTQEQITEYLSAGKMIPLHTFQTWKEAGYRVRRGQKARVTTKLWKFTKNAKEKHAGEEVDGENKPHYYLTKAFLFAADQVEKIELEEGVEDDHKI